MTHAPATPRIHLLSAPPRSSRAELMDGEISDHAELAENLRDIRRVNRMLGGVSTVTRHLPNLLASVPASRTVSVLDLATGSADIPVALLAWAERRGQTLHITASDHSVAMLDIARHYAGSPPEIAFAQYDARAVPCPDRSFDLVLCSLSLHHFEEEDAVAILREMARLARIGCIVNDLRRGRLGFAAAWMAARVTTRNRLTRHDAPLSVKRAYTPEELRSLLLAAGIRDATVTTNPWFRMAAVWRTAGG